MCLFELLWLKNLPGIQMRLEHVGGLVTVKNNRASLCASFGSCSFSPLEQQTFQAQPSSENLNLAQVFEKRKFAGAQERFSTF